MYHQDRRLEEFPQDGSICTISHISKEIQEELIGIRHHLHRNPELSMQEFKTSKFIVQYLKRQSIPCRITGNTGVIGDLMVDTEYPTLAIRAEIDALPIQEATCLPFASAVPGCMHACGHDAITALVMVLAKLLSQCKDQLRCNLRFLFEPGEEIGRGARYLMEHGALQAPKPDAILVFHFGNQEGRAMEIQKSTSTAAIGGLSIHVQGKTSHWSQRSEGIDALYAASRLVEAIHQLNETYRADNPFVLGFGMMQAGTAGNIMADSACLKGSLRTFTRKDYDAVFQELNRRACQIERETKAAITITTEKFIPPIVNDEKLIALGSKAGRSVFGDKFSIGTSPFLVGDNAAFYIEETPGLRMVFLAGKEGEEAYPVHHGKFDIEESVMTDALTVLYRMALQYPET